LKTELFLINKEYEDLRAEVDESNKRIEAKMRERDLLNKDVVLAEEKERDKADALQTLDGELKKLQNKIQGYKAEAQKLYKLIHQLEKDKQKYGIEASQANAKYYQCLEQVKLKNNLITKLQKKNIEAEGRLKQQQNLYEAVRSDRNLYSKNLLEAQEEIAELKMKFKRMTQQINQLKEEIQAKDNTIATETFSKQKYAGENAKLEGDIDKIGKQIDSCDQMIRTQESDIARLKYVITEAEQEKQKQRKDYEMVINERDILGTQLIKRNEELQILYEKIKIQQSTLDKGEIYYQERIEEIVRIQNQIADLKRLLIVSQNETACIPDLRREIFMLDKELLEQQQKAKFLTDELDKPLNVHRWRKLECTDPETYELIQKIQSLQKRLIAKTEEVSEKDVLIQEKEKLYIELKNILAKQSGPEVAEKLQVYQQNLKDRAKQLKEMVGELKNYQAQVNAYRFENERLDKQISDIKQMWFQSRRQGNGNLGVIREAGDEEYMANAM
jgi:chromosome segregation ATPase